MAIGNRLPIVLVVNGRAVAVAQKQATLGPGEDLSVKDAESAVLIADPGTECL